MLSNILNKIQNDFNRNNSFLKFKCYPVLPIEYNRVKLHKILGNSQGLKKNMENHDSWNLTTKINRYSIMKEIFTRSSDHQIEKFNLRFNLTVNEEVHKKKKYLL